MDTLPSAVKQVGGFRSALAVSGFRFRARLGFSIPAFFPRPARHYPRFRIWHPSSGHQRDFNPPELRAAQRTLCPLLTSPPLSMTVARHLVGCCQPTAVEISRGKTRHFRCASAGFTKCIPKPQMEDFAVTCPLVPDAPRLISGFCSSPRSFGFSFLQTLPRDNALAVLLAFGSAKTWLPDFHRHSYVPCPAHT